MLMSRFHHTYASAIAVPLWLAFSLRDYSLGADPLLCIHRSSDGYIAQEIADQIQSLDAPTQS
jgi:hypothetical protein